MVMFVVSNLRKKRERLLKFHTGKQKKNESIRSVRIINMNKKTQVVLIKKFSYGTKEIYEGTLRKARTLIPPSKKNQYTIINLETGEEINGK